MLRPTVAATVAVLAAVCAIEASATADRPSAGVRVEIYAPRGDPGRNCTRVFPLSRTVRAPAVLTGTMRALLRGPTAAERSRGYGGWLSLKTAGMLRSVWIR